VRVVLSDFITLDGVVQAPGGPEEDTDGGFTHGGWSMPFFDPEAMGAAIGDLMAETEALLFGRRTWQTMAAAWPERAGDPFADRMNEICKYVVSSTLAHADLTWSNTVLLSPDRWLEEIAELRARGEGVLQVMGSSTVARALIANDLVDEYRLMVNPITVGGGKGIFPTDGVARPLALAAVTTAATGVLICTYRLAGAANIEDGGTPEGSA
jgi:dihydrofolate reductase